MSDAYSTTTTTSQRTTLTSSDFTINPAISNYAAVQNSTPNRHGIIGYLDDADVAKHILDALI